MKVAVEGCSHGELDKIYEALHRLEEKNNIKIDLLIICGDFQAVRNPSDLKTMAVPEKYYSMQSFYKYYSGEKKAPLLTIFIGGNHEASNHLLELSYGGWVAPNIYYLGYAGVINVGGLRIAGLSGIYKGQDYLKGHFECFPFNESTKRSIYHIRNLEVFRLKQLKQPIDIMISHDWPRGIYNYGNVKQLLSHKKYFLNDIESNSLGSRPSEDLLFALRPKFWFAAHLHTKFSALVPFPANESKPASFTKFLALDKCLPGRRYLQVLDFEKGDPTKIEYDPEWLTILHLTNHLLSTENETVYMPGIGCSERSNFTPTESEISAIKSKFANDFQIPSNFVATVPFYTTDKSFDEFTYTPSPNPQTTSFCEKLGINDPLALLLKGVKFPKNEFSFVEENENDVTISSEPSCNFESSNSPKVEQKETASENIEEMEISFVIDRVGNRKSQEFSSSSVNSSPFPSKRANGESDQGIRKTMKRRNQTIYNDNAEE